MTELVVRQRLEPRGPAGALVLTDEQVTELGGGKRAAVRVQIAGVSLPLRLAVMGGQNLIGFSKATRAAFGVEIGDLVDATISVDTAPREVTVPPELAAALTADAEAASNYEKLAYTHRKEYAVWVGEAKQQATRDRRAAPAIEMLKAGKTRS